MRSTPVPPPSRTWRPDADGSVRLSANGQKAVKALIYGDNEDRAPSVRALERILDECSCTDDDREVIAYMLGISKQHPS